MKPFPQIKKYVDEILITKFKKEFEWKILIYNKLDGNEYYSTEENTRVRKFIRNCSFINKEDKNGDTLINILARGDFSHKHDNAILMKDFIEAGGNIHHKDSHLNPPLVQAVDIFHQNERDKVIELLLSNGANVNDQDYSGNTALMIGILKKQNNLRILIQPEMDITIKNKTGQTVIDLSLTDLNDPIDFNVFIGPADDLQAGPRTSEKQKEVEELHTLLKSLYEQIILKEKFNEHLVGKKIQMF